VTVIILKERIINKGSVVHCGFLARAPTAKSSCTPFWNQRGKTPNSFETASYWRSHLLKRRNRRIPI